MRLAKNTVAAVTGAGSGIGRALALALAREGCALALADKDAHSLANTAAEARKAGAGTVSTHAVDVADLAAMTRFRDEVKQAHRYVHLLVNNAGVALGGEFEQVSIDDMRWLIDINFWGVVHGTKLFLPLLRENRQAHIVNISSIFGIIAPAGQTAYAASKFAVRGFSEALRHELGDTRIRVTTVHPGGVRTNIANSSIPDDLVLTAAERARAEKRIRIFNEKVLTMPPDVAARVILDGVAHGRTRIVVTAQAVWLDRLIRLLPVGYVRRIAAFDSATFGD